MDLDGDGHLDILSGSYSDTDREAGLFHVLYGKGDGTFRKAEVLKGTDGQPLIISANGVVIRTNWHTVSQSSRPTQGVRLMHMSEGDRVVSIATMYGDIEADAIDLPMAADEDDDESVGDGRYNGDDGK